MHSPEAFEGEKLPGKHCVQTEAFAGAKRPRPHCMQADAAESL